MSKSTRSDGDEIVLAADFGTSGVKLGAVDPQMRILARCIEPYPLSLEGPGMAEQDPADWWTALCSAVHRLAAEVPELTARTKALVFCAQMCGLICADADGVTLRPCLIWLDKRSARLSREIVGGFPSVEGYNIAKGARWMTIANGAPSKNGMDPLCKMRWIMRHEPGTFEKTKLFLDVKDWLILRATGEATTTADSANLTWLMDTRKGREGWSPALSRLAGVPLSLMPRIVEGQEAVGRLTGNAAAELGLGRETVVIAGGGDVTATALGSGAVGDGELHICAGTSSWVSGFFPNRILSPAHSYATVTSSLGFRPLLIATQESAGSAIAWGSQMLGEAAIEESDPGDPEEGDPFFLPWLAGERVPVDDERLRGAFYGLGLRHDRMALKRAVYEGVAFNIRWAYSKVVRHKSVRTDGPLPLVGGAALNSRFAQTLADSLGRAVTVGDARYAGVLGAAAIAAPALKWHGSVWDAAKTIGSQPTRSFEPAAERVRLLDERYQRLAIVRKALVGLYRRQGVAKDRP